MGEQARLLQGKGLDEQPAHAGRIDRLLEGVDDLAGSAGDRDGRAVLLSGTVVDVELAVGLGHGPPAPGCVQRAELPETPGQARQVVLRTVLGLAPDATATTADAMGVPEDTLGRLERTMPIAPRSARLGRWTSPGPNPARLPGSMSTP
jgi:hypothetical protein